MRSIVHSLLEKTAFGRKLYTCYRRSLDARDKRKRCLRLQKHGREILEIVHNTLPAASIPFFIDYGTLLGCVREHGFIPHDDDIDFGVPVGMNNCAARILDLLESKGFEFKRAFELNGKIVEIAFYYKGISVDFFFKTMHKGVCKTFIFSTGGANSSLGARISVLETIGAKYCEVLPEDIIQCQFQGLSVNIPKCYEKCLSMAYGDTWRTPLKSNYTQKDKNIRSIVEEQAYIVDTARIRELCALDDEVI